MSDGSPDGSDGRPDGSDGRPDGSDGSDGSVRSAIVVEVGKMMPACGAASGFTCTRVVSEGRCCVSIARPVGVGTRRAPSDADVRARASSIIGKDALSLR